jgi:hypothetical protein
MGKGANKDLLGIAGKGVQRSNTLNDQASGTYGFIDPILKAEATNPQGYAPVDLAAMNTASQQSLGGSVGGATGEANLEAARTRNAGGFQGAIASSARSAQRQLSQNALQVQAANAQLKEEQKQKALTQLQQLYGIDQKTALDYLNNSTTALSEENKSHPLQQGLLTAGTFISDLTKGAQNISNMNSGG